MRAGHDEVPALDQYTSARRVHWEDWTDPGHAACHDQHEDAVRIITRAGDAELVAWEAELTIAAIEALLVEALP